MKPKPRHYLNPREKEKAVKQARKRKPYAPRSKRKAKRKNPAAGISPDEFLNTPAMQDFVGNMLLGIAMERLGIRGRDVLSVVASILTPSAVSAPPTPSDQHLGRETPDQPAPLEEPPQDPQPSTTDACSTTEESPK